MAGEAGWPASGQPLAVRSLVAVAGRSRASRYNPCAMRKAITVLGGVLGMAALFFPMFPLALLWPTRRWRSNVVRVYARLWSRWVLFLAGVRVVVRGREHLGARPAVLLFNHVNTLDFFVNATFAPSDTLVFGKRELVRVPFIGWMWLIGGHPMIDRRRRAQWEGVLADVAECLGSGTYRTMIAPEGTRSRDGRLGPFKKGAFHAAVQSGAPLVPCVLRGCRERLAGGRIVPGVVEVDVLPPIATTEWTLERLDAEVEAVRRVYLDALGQPDEAPGLEPSGAPAA